MDTPIAPLYLCFRANSPEPKAGKCPFPPRAQFWSAKVKSCQPKCPKNALFCTREINNFLAFYSTVGIIEETIRSFIRQYSGIMNKYCRTEIRLEISSSEKLFLMASRSLLLGELFPKISTAIYLICAICQSSA